VGNFLTGPEKRRGFMERLLVILAILVFLVDISLPLGVAGGVPYVAVILTAFWASRKRLLLLAAAVCTLLVVAGYFLSPAGGELWKVLANRSLAVFAIWTTAGLSHLRLQAVELLRESEARIRSILETAPDGILSFDQRGVAESFNPACEQLFGYRPEEVIGKEIDFLLDPHAHGRPNWLQGMLEEPSTCPREAMEILGRRHSGEEFPLLISIGEMRLGERRAYTAILRDITARKREERLLTDALHEAEQAREKVEALIRSVGDFLIVTDRDLRIVFMNKASERMLGVSLDQVSHSHAGRILGDTLSGLLDHLESAVSGSSPEISEEITLLFPGQEKQGYYQARSARVLGRSAGAGDIVTVLRDVTRERTLDRLKSEFVSNAAHELNTPLTSIMGYAELLLGPQDFREFTSEEKQNFLSEIYAKCEDLAQIVNQLLDVSRIESGRSIPLEKAPCDLTRRIARITENFRLCNPRHRFELALPEMSSALCLDAGKMDQVLENLLSNAVKYSPDGGRIRVEVQVNDQEYRFSVMDQGIGMTPEQQANMFERFYRSDTSDTIASGLGLGLNIAKAIIDGHDGRIEVESRPGKGTTITVSLPLSSC
jgi:PAS domain S-box-containing protein